MITPFFAELVVRLSLLRPFSFLSWITIVLISALLGSAAAASVPELHRRAVLGAGAALDPNGVKITALVPGAPAQKGGLRIGDVVSAIGSRPVHDVDGFVATVKSQQPGRQIAFRILRNGSKSVISVVLGVAPRENDARVPTRYQAIEVDGSLRRTLVTVPRVGPSRHPALLIVGGIGCYSIDGPGDASDAYSAIAHDLGARGFVVMRLEKSGIGDSEGPACDQADFTAETRSYELALQALRNEPFVDPHRVYVFGHSIGSMIGPILAGREAISGLIVADGVGRNWFEYELLNTRRQLVLDGEKPPVVDARLRLKEYCMHRFLIELEPESALEKVQPKCAEQNVYPASAAYMQQVAELNPADIWTKVNVPVLAIYGGSDVVTALEDHQRIVEMVNERHPGTASLLVIPGMDHHFSRAATQQEAWDQRVKLHKTLPYDSDLSAKLSGWLCSRENCVPHLGDNSRSDG